MTGETESRHSEKMAKKKASRDRLMATKVEGRGLLMVHTGKGKGKTTAAMGLVVRALGRGHRVGIVQFIKGAWETGEQLFFQRFPDLCTFKAMGEGFTWETQDRERDIAAANRAWEEAGTLLDDPGYRLVLLDELNLVLRYGYLSLDAVLDRLAGRREDVHVVVTGRNADARLIELADLVTDMTLVKHPFRQGVKAQEGIEY